ncbi:hypothetical protein H1R82_04745 [Thermoactinomyces intermedius]|jgi:hypothetical protein|uniref:Uncharacterized protein n=1 Tax=Thermoactinomyces intermedius TaxID=2024 RepID=A0A8I1DEK5_THEIN|nr:MULTISPECIES: hypothetical protein [Thermoactinomyces]MBA4547918.1 hypothetical protein [Thermoactinomyces intermedius]MBA4835944.1 hypothetical protein [Thermoactinomyces intermedius]MBH8593851.1 hypothetical protein [Thermoactinomyces intermedius]MBH8599898.1 hypothetical protein [Thermoactinomyces sp. CICC 23799]
MSQSTEKLLIETYKHINESRNLIEQLINQLGQEQPFIHHLPDDIQHLIRVALELSPDQRKTLRLFLESLKQE